jgi:hypothetical protein
MAKGLSLQKNRKKSCSSSSKPHLRRNASMEALIGQKDY